MAGDRTDAEADRDRFGGGAPHGGQVRSAQRDGLPRRADRPAARKPPPRRRGHDTRHNRNYIVNALGGKEWMPGNNVLGVDLKISALGGERYTPVDEAATLAHPDHEAQYDESRMYAMRFKPQWVGDFSISYKINRRRTAHEFAVKSVNATGRPRYMGHKYNMLTGIIEPRMFVTRMFNVSYRIEF